MSTEHPIEQEIRCVVISVDRDGNEELFALKRAGVTKIEACTKSGMHADIPYIRVWKDADCIAEFCQHNVMGIYFVDGAPKTSSP